MWTIEAVRQYIQELFISCDLELDCDVLVNKRFTSTLGRVSFKKIDGVVVPTKIEFNDELLRYGTEEDVSSTIIHEACHAIAALKTGEQHGHDKYFKQLCASFGLENEKSTCTPEYLKRKDSNPRYKYLINCPNCGVVGRYKRKTKAIKNLPLYSCSKCGSKELSYTQNY